MQRDAVDAAMEHLRLLGAIEPRTAEDENNASAVCRVTSLGRTIALLPVAPHWGAFERPFCSC
jgi:HrpA-like RNA helicase